MQQYQINLENSQQPQNTPLLQQYTLTAPVQSPHTISNVPHSCMVPGLANLPNVGPSQYQSFSPIATTTDISPAAIHSAHNMNQQHQITGFLPNTVMSTHAQQGVSNPGINHSPMATTSQTLPQDGSIIPVFQSQR